MEYKKIIKMKKYILIILFALTLTVAKGQSYTEVYLHYMPAVPFGETADYTGGISPRGVDFEANRFIGDDMSVGFNIGWTIFREKVSPELIEINDLDIFGTQFRYQNMVPVNVTFKKYFLSSTYTPFVGIGVGTEYIQRLNDIGVFSLSDDKWLFNIAPQVGVLYDFSGSAALSFKLRYNYSLKSGDFPAASYLSLGIGIGLN